MPARFPMTPGTQPQREQPDIIKQRKKVKKCPICGAPAIFEGIWIYAGKQPSPNPPAPAYQIEPNSVEFTLAQIVEINENIQKQRKEAARAATLAAEKTDNILSVLKKRYKNEMAILDYVEMIECEVMALRQSTTAAQEEQHP